jgi:hypothetical protein
MTDLLYYMFYCSAGNDGTKSKHEMVAYGMEIVATQLLSFFTFIIVGALNIRISVILLWLLIIAANGFIAYFLINGYYIKSGKYNKILEKYDNTSNKKKAFYKTIVIFIFIVSFILLLVGGITMSYLFSRYE